MASKIPTHWPAIASPRVFNSGRGCHFRKGLTLESRSTAALRRTLLPQAVRLAASQPERHDAPDREQEMAGLARMCIREALVVFEVQLVHLAVGNRPDLCRARSSVQERHLPYHGTRLHFGDEAHAVAAEKRGDFQHA